MADARVRVASLRYHVDPKGKLRFRNDVPVEHALTLDRFKLVVRPPLAVATPADDFTTIEEARSCLDPQLDAWRIWVRLTELGDLLPFEFQEGIYEACNPPTDGGHLFAGPATLRMVGQVAELFQSRATVPAPAEHFVANDLVRVGVALYGDAETLHRHTLKIAFAYLTILEAEYGDQKALGRKLGFNNQVLAEYKELSSRGGEPIEARKVDKKSVSRIEFTEERRLWLLKVFRELILRYGRISASGPLSAEFCELCPGQRSDFYKSRPRGA